MVDDRNHLASLEYWRRPQERVPQRFYVAFCLLMSSIQDWILSLKEIESQNLNWSATCSYYSLVHGGRLLCFLALGDYPTQHPDLRKLMAGMVETSGNRQTRPNRQTPGHRQANSDGYPFDWLRGFGRLEQARHTQAIGGELAQKRELLAAYLEDIGVREARTSLDDFGRLLKAAGPLRNDSNYEALLIAHEFHHIEITEAFESLANAMARAAGASIPLFIDAFNGFRRLDPDLAEDRRAYESFLYELVHRRLGDGIRSKLAGMPTPEARHRLEDRLLNVERLIGAQATGAQFLGIEQRIRMDNFGNKINLMGEFQRRIARLRATIGNSSQEVI